MAFLNGKVIYSKDSNILFEIRDIIENRNGKLLLIDINIYKNV